MKWFDANKKLPPVEEQVICKVKNLAWTEGYAVGYIRAYPNKSVWMIEGKHVTHYKKAVNNCVIEWAHIEAKGG